MRIETPKRSSGPYTNVLTYSIVVDFGLYRVCNTVLASVVWHFQEQIQNSLSWAHQHTLIWFWVYTKKHCYNLDYVGTVKIYVVKPNLILDHRKVG